MMDRLTLSSIDRSLLALAVAFILLGMVLILTNQQSGRSIRRKLALAPDVTS